ncbi:MAG: hypothetical protein K0R64_1006 [Novosphingobium lindaniclasticum]|jgi:hypothetical protein|uniref:Uncharacterized protein n=1 Tax=Novosphingobium lindaniclasticum LE124 TaxID=1096930 RepID=T0I4E3_9SPHN|nr:hypothetical protein [Novosphingobium lindaniclasticum]EQB19268.1 hypothetical protein L284_02320 [Novosphingobium lindaniclasticum LE124]MDF2638022.1 hypothetical protein [Novosphingobium lindaniclasticum]
MMVEPITAPQHFVPPTARELRSQAVHRLQVGLFGLCAMLLIVGLANIINDRTRLIDTTDPIQQVVAVDAKPKKAASDPLADIGVVPAADPVPTPAPAPEATGVTDAEASGVAGQ